MRRCVLILLTLTALGAGLVGCGRFGGEQRAAWRTQAEEACMSRKLVRPTAYMSRIAEIDGPGACGITYPFKVQAFAEGSVGLTNRVTLACPIIPEIDGWIRDTVQPAAELYFGTEVTEIRAGTYSCRGRNNQSGAKTSEHAFGNAIDVMSFRFADGRDLSVERGWKGVQAEADFLREVFVGACLRFTTVLAPGSDVFHYNHLHLDLARHDPRGQRRICKPILKFEPRLDPETGAARPRVRPVIRPLREPAEPLEIEDESDPYAVSRASPPPIRAVATTGPAPSGPRLGAALPPPLPVPPSGAARARPGETPGVSAYAKTYATARIAPEPDGPSRRANPSGTADRASNAGLRESAGRPAAGPAGPAPPLVLQPQLLSGTGLY